jgi:hypothetical protein
MDDAVWIGRRHAEVRQTVPHHQFRCHAKKRFDRTEQRRRFGAKDAWTPRWLDVYWLDGMFETAFKQARDIPLEPGIDGGE